MGLVPVSLPADTSLDEEEMEEAGPNPQMLQGDPPDKMETLSGADGDSQAKLQGAEGDPLVPPHQGGMLDNSIEDVLFTMFEDLTPQEQQAVTERLEHTKNCLLARKVPDLSEQQAIRGDATVNSNSHPSMQVPLAPQSFPPIDVEMATEQSGTGTSAAITDSPQMPKNGSVFFDRDRSLNHITEFD
ncbi:UNVERIFIED_CONTAM: hypothetical protein K2H54_035053 [Gekko kuhli]